MADPSRNETAAGGVFIAIGAIAGAYFGNREAQATAGLLIGAGAGIVLALLMWLRDRRKG